MPLIPDISISGFLFYPKRKLLSKACNYIVTPSCADPEMFVRGGPTLIRLFFIRFVFLFLVDERREDPNTTRSGPYLARQRNVI